MFTTRTKLAILKALITKRSPYYVQFYIKGVSAGAGSANITATNYQPYSNTVTVTP